MAFADIAFKAVAGGLGLATLVLGADLVHAMTKEAIVGKAPVGWFLHVFRLQAFRLRTQQQLDTPRVQLSDLTALLFYVAHCRSSG